MHPQAKFFYILLDIIWERNRDLPDFNFYNPLELDLARFTCMWGGAGWIWEKITAVCHWFAVLFSFL